MKIGNAMNEYLVALRTAGHPLSVRELAERTGRAGWMRGRQYGPAQRLVKAGLARYVDTDVRGRYLIGLVEA